jgi:predicted dehydrogenase
VIRFGILGAAKIAPMALIEPAASNPSVEVVCIAARDEGRAREFAEKHQIPKVLATYQDVIDDPEIDAVYIPLPIAAHADWSIKALKAGKHVLCEKSLASNHRQAQRMHDQALKNDRLLMDAFHYRYHPFFEAAVEVMESGVLGELQHVFANFQIQGPVPSDDIRRIYAQGGGVLMDIGCYPVSWVRHLTGLEPTVSAASAVIDADDIDIEMTARLTLGGGVEADIRGSMAAEQSFKAEVIVTGSLGKMILKNPLVPQLGHALILDLESGPETKTFTQRSTYAFQLDAFVAAVAEGGCVATDSEDGVKQMAVIDACYQQAGLPVRGLKRDG